VFTYVPGVSGAAGTITAGAPVVADTQAPTVPTNLTATNLTTTGFTLS
jgi:hypothetical protein